MTSFKLSISKVKWSAVINTTKHDDKYIVVLTHYVTPANAEKYVWSGIEDGEWRFASKADAAAKCKHLYDEADFEFSNGAGMRLWIPFAEYFRAFLWVDLEQIFSDTTMVIGHQIPLEFITNGRPVTRIVDVDNTPFDDTTPTVECDNCGEQWFADQVSEADDILGSCEKCRRESYMAQQEEAAAHRANAQAGLRYDDPRGWRAVCSNGLTAQ